MTHITPISVVGSCLANHVVRQMPSRVFANLPVVRIESRYPPKKRRKFPKPTLAMEFVGLDLPEDALRRFDRVLALDPTYVPAQHQKAVTLVGLGRLDDARSALTVGMEAARRADATHAESKMQALLDSLRR